MPQTILYTYSVLKEDLNSFESPIKTKANGENEQIIYLSKELIKDIPH